MTKIPINKNRINIKKDYKKDVLSIWEKFANNKICFEPNCEYRKHPLLPNTVEKNSLMFIGMNPSFKKGLVIPEIEKNIGFYELTKEKGL